MKHSPRSPDRTKEGSDPAAGPHARRLLFLLLGLATFLGVTLVPGATAAAYDPAADGYSMAAITKVMGATKWWDAGYTGRGIDVAIIDTGIVPVEGLATPGKVIYGPDLSLESQARNLTHLDTNGHGTFMAGLIAGKDSALTSPYSYAPATAYRGVAPDARIVSIKVGTADGGVDITQVIAAIDWVVQHKNDNGLNIRVLNLSYGTNSGQSALVDPLSYAAEQAWKAGIVVVAASGNDGFQKKGGVYSCMANPAYNPQIIAVGGVDTKGNATDGDDRMAPYSSGGAGSCKNPDFAAPGSHIQGLRVPNSFIDSRHPEARLGDRYFRGSGTSEAAAITSGATALVLQKYPDLTPDQVKRFFAGSAHGLGATQDQQGAGEIRLAEMIKKTPERYVQKLAASTGTGSLDLARGSDRISREGVALSGEVDIFGKPFISPRMAALETTRSSWVGGTWNGSTWSGSSWSGSSWSGSTWSGSSWSGRSWSGSSWSGSSWSGSSWSGSSWSGSSWSGSSWSGDAWATGSWN